MTASTLAADFPAPTNVEGQSEPKAATTKKTRAKTATKGKAKGKDASHYAGHDKREQTAGATICEMLIKGATFDEINAVLQSKHFKEKCGQDETSARQQVAWYRSQLKRGLRGISYVEGVPVVVDLKRHSDKRLGKNQLKAPKTKKASKGKKAEASLATTSA